MLNHTTLLSVYFGSRAMIVVAPIADVLAVILPIQVEVVFTGEEADVWKL